MTSCRHGIGRRSGWWPDRSALKIASEYVRLFDLGGDRMEEQVTTVDDLKKMTQEVGFEWDASPMLWCLDSSVLASDCFVPETITVEAMRSMVNDGRNQFASKLRRLKSLQGR